MDSPLAIPIVGLLYLLGFGALSYLRRQGLSARFAIEGLVVTVIGFALKYAGLLPWEVWISEAQERMVLAVPPEHGPAVIEAWPDAGHQHEHALLQQGAEPAPGTDQ